MFISNNEKQHLLDKVKLLEAVIKDMSLLSTEIIMLKAKVKVLEGAKATPKKQTTAAQRAKQREYMRKYKARKKAEKLAQQATA